MFSFRKKKQDLSSLSDDALFRLYKETKDKESFGEIYKRYAKLVYGACFKYMKNREEAKDVMMDVFEMLMEKIPKQENINFISTWIYTVTRNKCLIKLREAKKLPKETFEYNFLEKNSDFHMENQGFLRLYNEEGQDQDEIIQATIEKLSPEQRACIKAFYLNNMSYKQIEEQLGFPLVKVKSHLQNGKRNLKVLLQETQIRT